jgi:hypothetical protein
MSRLKTVARAAVAVLLVSDAAAALCAKRSVTASLLEWLYAKAAGGKGGAPFIMIGNTPFSPSEIAVLASPCILGVLLAVLFRWEIIGMLAQAFDALKHRHSAADSLPTMNVSSDELFGEVGKDGQDAASGSGGGGKPGSCDDAPYGDDDPDGGADADEDPYGSEDGEYEGGWFDEAGWHDEDGFGSDERAGGDCDPDDQADPAQHDFKSAGGDSAGGGSVSGAVPARRARDGSDKD